MDRYTYNKLHNDIPNDICNDYCSENKEIAYGMKLSECSSNEPSLCSDDLPVYIHDKGPKGEQGEKGDDGEPSGNLFIFVYSANLDKGKISFDMDTNEFSNQKLIKIAEETTDSLNILNWISTIKIGDKLRVGNLDDKSKFGLYEVTNYTTNANEFEINSIVSNGEFNEDDKVVVEIIYSGIKGDKGEVGEISFSKNLVPILVNFDFSRSNMINLNNTYNCYTGDWYQFYTNNIYNVNNPGYGYYLTPGNSSNADYKFSNHIANLNKYEIEKIYEINNSLVDKNHINYAIGIPFCYDLGCIEGISVNIISESEFIGKTVSYRIAVEKHMQNFEDETYTVYPVDNTELKETISEVSDDKITSKGTRIKEDDGSVAIHKDIITDLNSYVDLFIGEGYDKNQDFYISDNKLTIKKNEMLSVVFTPITSDTDNDEITQYYIHKDWNDYMKLLNISVSVKVSVEENGQ